MCMSTAPDPWVIAIAGGLAGIGLVVCLAVWQVRKNKRRQHQIDTLRHLLAQPPDGNNPSFGAAITQARMVFRGHRTVVDVLDTLRLGVSTLDQKRIDQALAALLPVAAQACKCSATSLTDTAPSAGKG